MNMLYVPTGLLSYALTFDWSFLVNDFRFSTNSVLYSLLRFKVSTPVSRYSQGQDSPLAPVPPNSLNLDIADWALLIVPPLRPTAINLLGMAKSVRVDVISIWMTFI
ncbi:hypothetical protein CPB84DRAFT_1771798 [Gymnopilus junonius]|uniref:Uncharacterized protein n=1 Tax=Gymnopilus junonius TaxID=109634 RepID=A0A9P5TPC2_GYMJU|nr:hypothetical protein CPB84DRAFT_1771798 [Gymnopilus junonius]